MKITRRSILQVGAVAPLALACRGGGGGQVLPRWPADGSWEAVRGEFALSADLVNLDNGWASSPPRIVREAFRRHLARVEAVPAQVADLHVEVTAARARPAIARLLGVPERETALVRNATEGLATVLLGLSLSPGDEIVCSAHDYFHQLDMIEERRREGVVVRMIEPPIPAPSAQALVDAYAAAMTDRTRLVLITHMSNRTGQIYPAARIAELAHARGAQVLVDAAQTLAHIEHGVPDLGCDYYAASLHKWLMAPLGTGVLWIRPELEPALRSRFAAAAGATGMMRFQHVSIGSVCEPAFAAVAEAVDFHRGLGGKRKEERLRLLARHLRQALAEVRGLRFYAVDEPWASCAIVTFEVAGRDPAAIVAAMREKHGILVQAQTWDRSPALRGVRVSPSIYNSPEEIDRCAAALADVVG